MLARRVRQGESGASAVEFALLLPLLVVLVFGMLYGGILLNDRLSVTQAAREGARFGATLPIDPSGVPDPAWYGDIRERAGQGSAGTFSDPDVVCVWYVPDGGTALSNGNLAGCPAGPPGDLPSPGEGDLVVVYAELPASLELVLYSFDTTLRARAVARHEGGTT